MSEFEKLQAIFECAGLCVGWAGGVRCVRLPRLRQSRQESPAVPPDLLASVCIHWGCKRIWVKTAARSSVACLAKTSGSAWKADGQRLVLVGVEPVVLGRFLFNLPLELKTLYQRHKQLHEYRCDGWFFLMSVLIKSYNRNVEKGPNVFSKDRETTLYFL